MPVEGTDLVMDVVAAAGGDRPQRRQIARHGVGLDRLALDDPGIAETGLPPRLPAIDEGDRPAALLQVEGGADADHAGAQNDRAAQAHRLGSGKDSKAHGRAGHGHDTRDTVLCNGQAEPEPRRPPRFAEGNPAR